MLTHDEIITKGTFSIPKALLNKGLKLSEMVFMMALLHFEDDFLSKSKYQLMGKWFFVSDKTMRQKVRLSKKTLARCRKALLSKELIAYERGYTGRPNTASLLTISIYTTR